MSGPLAVVTGASGFVGSHVVDELLRQGIRVRCLVRASSPRDWLEGKPVEILVIDMDDAGSLADAVRDAAWIVHAAGLTKGHSAAAFHEANVAVTERMLRAALAAGPALRRFVFISSQSVAGPSFDGIPVTEARPPAPVSPYGESKLRAEQLVLQARGRLPVVVLRPPAVYGPRDRETLRYFLCAKWHLRLELRRGGRFSLVHAGDLARATVLAMTDERVLGGVFFVAGPDITGYEEIGILVARSMRTWAVRVVPPRWLLGAGAVMGDAFATLVGKQAFLNPQKLREITGGDWIVSSARFRSLSGWEPRVPLEEGMESTARWYREAGWI